MRKLLLITAVAALVFLNAAVGYTAPSGNFDVLVTIEQNISIEVSGGPITFPPLGVNQTAVSSSAISVKNDGSGITEAATLSVTDPAGWTHGTPGEEYYRMSFMISETQPLVDDPNWKTAATFSESLAYNDPKNLWVKLETPTATSVITQQTIQVTVTAAAP